MLDKFSVRNGRPFPLGSTPYENSINFALFTAHATSVTIYFYTHLSKSFFHKITLDPILNKTGNIWHIEVVGLEQHVEYAYSIDGPNEPEKGHIFNSKHLLLDPYAKALSCTHIWGPGYISDDEYKPKAKIVGAQTFDWQGVKAPNIPRSELIIYEMHVRGFTIDKSSKAAHPGTFKGIVEKIPYLKTLGVNAVELLPVFEFDECENKNKNPFDGSALHNYWGYSTVNFFCPMNRYSSGENWLSAINEFKEMVRELHRNGIEVILDVVYNHTSEGNEIGPIHSFKGIDNASYYILDKEGKYLNFSGTGNTFNCNHPVVRKLILDSLRYWVTEMGIDGFRFDLASVLTRGTDGNVLSHPPLIEEILECEELVNTKLIAEAWDAAGLYQVGNFPGKDRWSEWNGKYRDTVRKFVKGTDGLSGAFATAICGSEDLYKEKGFAYCSINFITAHDGYTFLDLVSYQQKHNLANGENNNDGANDNESWNCGAEGATHSHHIDDLRKRQMKNFMCVLFFSLGIPMLHMGDEYGHTRDGNNNPYCQDNKLNWFLWDELEKNKYMYEFCQKLIAFRKTHKHLFCREHFLKQNDITWHQAHHDHPMWDHKTRLVACILHDPKGNDLYMVYHAGYTNIHITLPTPPKNKHWYRIIDTSLDHKSDFVEKNAKTHPEKFTYDVHPYTVVVLQAF